jgi:hypothetical protein
MPEALEKSEARNPKLAKPEPKKPKTESWQRMVAKTWSCQNCTQIAQDSGRTKRNKFKRLKGGKVVPDERQEQKTYEHKD